MVSGAGKVLLGGGLLFVRVLGEEVPFFDGRGDGSGSVEFGLLLGLLIY